ncbi:MAG TPA: DUF4350 domain-containing protein [Bryobacteraceae bacterium]|nr:DUF4350 domain-containing protein [Bryobacteraceae bacterium]
MPAGLNPADRRLLTIAGGAALILLLGTIVAGPSQSDESQIPSIYSSGRAGARAAWLLLEDLHYDVRAWEEAPSALPAESAGTLLILAEPAEAPSAHDREALRDFVNRGGRVLFCGDALAAFFSHAGTAYAPPDSGWAQFHAIFPGRVTRGAETITMQAQSIWKKRDASLLWLYGTNDWATVVEWRIGAGSVLWWAGATPLTNAGITQTGNLNLFLNSVTDSPRGRPSVILWDEYFHGQRTGLISYAAQTPALWAVAQVLLVGLAVLFTFSRRSGPIVSPAAPSRLSPLEFVDTMGGLYRRAGAASIPVEVAYRHLRAVLVRRLGVAVTMSEEDIARLAERRFGLPGRNLAEDLRHGSSYCYDQRILPKDALALVKRLAGYAARLEPARSAEIPKENG